MAPMLIDHDQRRRELAQAVWRVVLQEGVSAVSVRTVATEANLSVGSLRHIFPSQGDLLVAALELVQENARGRILALPSTLLGRNRAIAVACELLPLDDERRAELEVQLSLSTLAVSNSRLRMVRDEANAAVLFACEQVLALVNNEQPLRTELNLTLEAARLHALIDGLASHLVQNANHLTSEQAVTILESHLISLIANSQDHRAHVEGN